MAAQGLRLQRRARLDAAGPAARPGLGVIDSTGEPKPVWYAMRRAFRPVQVVFTDEGTNGLDVHVVNETDAALDVELEVVCLRGGKQQVVSGSRAFKLAARDTERLACTALFGAFFDTTYAFRFGPPAHDASVARLRSLADGAILAELPLPVRTEGAP